MRKTRKPRRILLWIGFFLLVLSGSLFAQEFPTKPINLIIPSAPGQIGDVTTRMLATKAEKFLGQPFVFTNNNVGGGAVALGMVAKAKPDGYTIGSTATGILIWRPFVLQVNYKLEDFASIMHCMAMESGLVVKTDSPWKTLKELVAYAKGNPGKVSYAITSAGVPMDLAMRYVAKEEGLRWTAVPTPGADPNNLLLGGHVSAYSGSTSWVPHVKSGAFRLLAVHSAKRMKDFPNVPTFRELGYDFVHESESLMIAPAGTPEPVVKKLDDAFQKAMEEKDFVDLMNKFGNKITYRNHEELRKYLFESRESIGRIIKNLEIAPEPEKR